MPSVQDFLRGLTKFYGFVFAFFLTVVFTYCRVLSSLTNFAFRNAMILISLGQLHATRISREFTAEMSRRISTRISGLEVGGAPIGEMFLYAAGIVAEEESDDTSAAASGLLQNDSSSTLPTAEELANAQKEVSEALARATAAAQNLRVVAFRGANLQGKILPLGLALTMSGLQQVYDFSLRSNLGSGKSL